MKTAKWKSPMTDELVKVAEDSARGGFFLLSGNAFSTAIMAISTIFVARLLGPELYGQYSLALIIPQLLFLLTDLGLNQGIIKFAATLRAKGEINHVAKIIKYGLMLRALAGIAIFITTYALADFFASVFLKRPELAFYIRIASIGVVFQVISTTAGSAFIGLDKTEYNALALNIQAVAKVIISISLVLLGFSVAGAILGVVASYIVAASASAFMLYLMIRERQSTENSHSIREDFRTLMRYGTPLYLSVLLIGFTPVYQNVILALFTTDADIGNYKAATNFATLLTVVTLPITAILLPAFSKLDTANTQKTRTFFRLANKYTAMLVLPITVLIIIFSNQIVRIVYGSMYRSGSLFLASYVLMYFLVGFGYLTLASFFNGFGKTKITFTMNLITFLIVLVLSPVLTQSYGVLGLIIAFLIANVADNIYAFYVARSSFKIEFDVRSMIKIYLVSFLSSIPAVITLRFSSFPPLLNVIVGGLLYLFTYTTLTPLMKIVDQQELKAVANILAKIKPLVPIYTPVLRYQRKILSYL